MKKAWIVIGVLFATSVIFTSIGDDKTKEEKAVNTSSYVETTKSEKQTEEPVEVADTEYKTETVAEQVPREEQETEAAKVVDNTILQEQLKIVEQNMGYYVSVSYNEELNAIALTPINQELISEIRRVAAGDQNYISQWKNSFVSGMQDLSKSIADISPNRPLTVMNPDNGELILLTCLNGVVVYDFSNDL